MIWTGKLYDELYLVHIYIYFIYLQWYRCVYKSVVYRPLAVGVAQHFQSAILEYNLPCIVIEAYECFDAYLLSGLQMYMLFQYMITQAVLYKITERKY